MYKAVYKGKYKEKYSDAVNLFYEYRGHEYMITDEHNGYSETMQEKHRLEQGRIDREIKEREQENFSDISTKTNASEEVLKKLYEFWEG